MQDKRFYQRYAIIDEERGNLKVEVQFDGLPVDVVDFSLGGLSVISEKPYIVGDIVNILVSMESRGRIDLLGKVARVKRLEKAWSVAVDLKNYKSPAKIRKK